MTVPSLLLQLTVDYRPSLQTLHLGLFGAMTLLALASAVWIHRTRSTRGATLFAATLLLVGLRTGSDVAGVLVGELWTLQTVLAAANPLIELCALLVFARFAGRYAGVGWLTDERATRAMVAVAAVATVAIATNPVHQLVFTAFYRVGFPFTYVGAQVGPLGLLLVAVEGVVVLVGAGVLASAFTAGMRPAWWPATVLSIAISQAMLVGGLQLGGGGLLPQYDYHAIALGGFVFTTTLALFDHGLRRIEVVARDEILDEIDDAVLFLDADGAVVDYNDASRGLFEDLTANPRFTDRFEGTSLLGTTPTTTALTLDSSEEGRQQRWTAFESGSAGSDSDGKSSQRGRRRHFLAHGTPVRSETNALLGYTVRFVDVTDLKRRSRELRAKNDKLDQFASTVSHDLRNPLTVASGYLDMLANPEGGADGDEAFDLERARGHLDKVDVSLDRMNVIIDDILALIENADPVTDTSSVDFEDVATAAWNTVDTGQATFHVATTGQVEADPDRLQRLLENLFRNAVDHVGEDVAIETALNGSGFYVADDGPGIPVADRETIFEHGYTTGEEGTGLGLSIVAQLAEAHDWEVALDPDHDGAKFVVSGCETGDVSGAASAAN